MSIIKTIFAETGEFPERGIVPECGPTGPITKIVDGVATTTPQCGWTELFMLGENIVNTLIAGAFLITTLFLIIGAFKMIISQGSPDRLSSAKQNITSAIIGLVIVLVSWVVLNFALNAFIVDKENCHREWYRFGEDGGLKCELTSPAEE